MKMKIMALFLILMVCGALCSCGEAESSDNGQIEIDSNSINQEESVNEESISYVGIKVYESQNDSYTDYDVLVKNNTDEIIHTVSLDVQFLDEEDSIVDTAYLQEPVRVLPGQIIAINGMEEKDVADKMTVTGFSYYVGDGYDSYVSDQFEEIPEAVSVNEDGEYLDGETEFDNSAIYTSIDTGASSDLSVESLEVGKESGDYIYYYAYIKNETENAINTISINFIYLDEKGNIKGSTYPQESTVVQSGQKIKIEGLVLKSEAEYVTVDGYSYYDSNDEYYRGFFAEIPQAISLVGAIEADNDSQITVESEVEVEETDSEYDNRDIDAVIERFASLPVSSSVTISEAVEEEGTLGYLVMYNNSTFYLMCNPSNDDGDMVIAFWPESLDDDSGSNDWFDSMSYLIYAVDNTMESSYDAYVLTVKIHDEGYASKNNIEYAIDEDTYILTITY